METTQNSLTLYLCAFVSAMFDDIAFTYTGPRDWKRDKTRLLHEIQQHGSQVLTITLPAVGKSLDQALDVGLYQPCGNYLGKCRKGEKVPVFLRDLFIQIFNPTDGVLRKDPNLAAVADLRQLLLGGNKLLLACTTRRTRDEVYDFYRTEAGNRSPSLDWSSDAPLSAEPRRLEGVERIGFTDLAYPLSPHESGDQLELPGCSAERFRPASSLRELRILQRTFDEVFSALGDFSEEESLRPKHGPGAVSDLRRGVSKYLFDDWPSKLECLYPADFYAVHDFMCSSNVDGPGEWRNREVPSKLIAVPKTQKSPRLIAAEPSQYQWIQQLLWQQLESKIEWSPLFNCISFRDQSHNQAAALFGSNGGDNVTIDLSSASDRLTCWVVERACRSNWTLLDRLHASRTRWVRNNVDSSLWDFLVLKKFSTMGSTAIFPIQSMVYACLAMSAVIATKKVDEDWYCGVIEASSLVRVFGDDIVVPKYAYECTSRYLSDLGLKVNTKKTFTGVNFRESCGVDGFRGVNVTPTYLRRIPASASSLLAPSLLKVSNNFWRRGYWHTAKWLDSQMSVWDHLIPVTGPGVEQPGRFSFCGSSLTHLSSRWDKDLHERQVRVLSMITKRRRTRGSSRHDLMQWFIEKPEPDLQWEAGTDQDQKVVLRPGWQSHTRYANVTAE